MAGIDEFVDVTLTAGCCGCWGAAASGAASFFCAALAWRACCCSSTSAARSLSFLVMPSPSWNLQGCVIAVRGYTACVDLTLLQVMDFDMLTDKSQVSECKLATCWPDDCAFIMT